MHDIVEQVDLPEAGTRPLLHPLDVAEARRSFLLGWALGVVTSPAVGVAIGALAWWASGNLLVAVVAGLPVVLLGTYVSRRAIEDAWAFVPRRRQDRARALPASLDLIAGAVTGFAILVSALIVSQRLAESDIPLGVRQFVLGSGVAVALLVAFDVGASIVARRGSYVDRPLFGIAVLIGIVVSLLDAAGQLLPGNEPGIAPDALIGAALVVVVGAVAWAWQVATRRTAKV